MISYRIKILFEKNGAKITIEALLRVRAIFGRTYVRSTIGSTGVSLITGSTTTSIPLDCELDNLRGISAQL